MSGNVAFWVFEVDSSCWESVGHFNILDAREKISIILNQSGFETFKDFLAMYQC